MAALQKKRKKISSNWHLECLTSHAEEKYNRIRTRSKMMRGGRLEVQGQGDMMVAHSCSGGTGLAGAYGGSFLGKPWAVATQRRWAIYIISKLLFWRTASTVLKKYTVSTISILLIKISIAQCFFTVCLTLLWHSCSLGSFIPCPKEIIMKSSSLVVWCELTLAIRHLFM